MVALVGQAGVEAHAADYFSGGYSSLGDFIEAMNRSDLWVFEPTSADAGHSQADVREGKRGLFAKLLESLGRQPIDYLEFGVMSCRTFDRVIEWTSHPEARFYGFDTFEGLPAPWVREAGGGEVRLVRQAGELRAVNPPIVYDKRALLFKGLFHETLPGALETAFPNGRNAERPLFINIDSDLYSSALYALTTMHPLLRSGDHLYFDELLDAMNEFSAFNDYIRAYHTKTWFVPVARAFDGVLFRVDMPAPSERPAEVIARDSTRFLDRMKAYARARGLTLQSRATGTRQPSRDADKG